MNPFSSDPDDCFYGNQCHIIADIIDSIDMVMVFCCDHGLGTK